MNIVPTQVAVTPFAFYLEKYSSFKDEMRRGPQLPTRRALIIERLGAGNVETE